MAHVMAVTLPVPGCVFPFIPILEELKRRGHRITLASASPTAPRPTFAQLSTAHIPWSGPSVGDSASNDRPSFHRLSSLNAFVRYGEEIAQGVEQLVTRLKPDFLLVDPLLWGGMVVAEASGLAWASVAHNPLCFRALGVDPRGPGWPPPTTWGARVRHRVLELALDVATADHLADVNRVRRGRAIEPLERMGDVVCRPPLILATTAEPFEYPRSDWPPALAFVGPMLCDPSTTLADMPAATDDRPLILVSGSTITAQGAAGLWAEHVLATLADQPFRVVTTLPTESISAEYRRAGAAHELVSHSDILPRTACVICHGGPGIVHKALWHGVPVVAIPFAMDRFEVAQRLEVAKAGVMLPLAGLKTNELLPAIQRALHRKPGAERIGERFRAMGGAALAANLIEQQLEASSGRATAAQRTLAHRS
jgi:UDP:flavonoid glycosyltransferase YjiC (YdhE family)